VSDLDLADRPPRVIVVGSVNEDLVASVDRLPAPGETVIGARFGQHHGGKGGNQAVAAARLGALTSFVGAVGDDAFGRAARIALEAEGVDVSELRTLRDASTGVALILVDAGGENSIAVAGGANAALTHTHVREAFGRLQPRLGDVVLVGHEIPTRTATEALRLARASGATTIFNPAPATGVTPEALAVADILTPNRGEAAQLVGDSSADGGHADGGADGGEAGDDALGTALLGAMAGGGRVLMTLGAGGARLIDQEETVTIPAPDVAVVDTVGAGDTLNGALAAGLAAGLPVRDAARLAVTAAALAVTRAGAREGMPSARELEAALAPPG
jgi:ribokinase